MASSATTLARANEAPDLISVFHRAPVAGLVIDATGLVSAVNKAALRLLQRTEADVIGHDFSELVRGHEQLVLDIASNQATPLAAPTIRRRIELPHVSNQATDLLATGLDDGSVLVQIVESFGHSSEDDAIEQQRAFRSALIELSELSHEHINDADFYDRLLSRAIEVVPGAQAGSILIRELGTDDFRFAAANGFDLALLQTRSLSKDEMFRDLETPQASINHDLASMELDPAQADWLAAAGRIQDIVVNVSAPVHIAGEPTAFISLDNFDDRNAFCETSVEMTTVLGRLIADLMHRRRLESELRRERATFKHQAMHDELTGLANRRQIETALRSMLDATERTNEPFALYFIDIDDFKMVNDTHGHDVGDDVLIAVAEELTSRIRGSDLVGRWGGDEFMIIAPGTATKAKAKTLANRILDSFHNELILANDTKIKCNLSIGAVRTANGSHAASSIVNRSDEALYAAKKAGKNTFRIDVS